MNRKKKLLRVVVVEICLVLIMGVNVGEDGTPDQEVEASPQQQDGASWYQVAVLCLLSAILVCVIKKR